MYSPRIDEYEPLRKQCDTFVECIKKGNKPRSDGINGLRVVAILEGASRSLKLAGRQVQLRPPKEIISGQGRQNKAKNRQAYPKVPVEIKMASALRV